MTIEILSKPDDVVPFVDEAQRAADTEKRALGFLPEQAFKQAAYQGKLLIAVVNRPQTSASYAGHLIHGGVFPRAKIFQVFTLPEFRKRGIARRLVEAIVAEAERCQFMSILAQVADDLRANTFWEHLGFGLVRTRPGGLTTGRQINIRIKELDTLQLFGSGIAPRAAEDLKLMSRLFDVSPVYALDINILFDLVKRRTNLNEVGRIIRASFNNVVRLAVTDEFIEELRRTSKQMPDDPVLEFALKLPRLPRPPSESVRRLAEELGKLIFPNQMLQGQLRNQDQSDLVHLATAIHNEVAGFITGEKAILRARALLQAIYSIDVVGAEEFAEAVESWEPSGAEVIQALSEGQTLQVKPIRADGQGQIQAFLDRMKCPRKLAQDTVRSNSNWPHRKMIVTCDGTIIAFASWDIPSAIRPHAQVFLCVDEDHSAMALAAEFLVDAATKETLYEDPAQFSLRLLPGHVTTRQIAISHGFRPAADESSTTSLQKISLGQTVTAANWLYVRQRLKTGMNLALPDRIPEFQSVTQDIDIGTPTGQIVRLRLFELENLLSPALLLLPGRTGAIVPIRKVYATDLLGGGNQLRLTAGPEAVLRRDRAYFSHLRTASVLRKGVPLVFYESARNGGSASATAIARATRVEVISMNDANSELFNRGVLDNRILRRIYRTEKVLATTIDSIILFKKPVHLDRLRLIGAVDGANLVTARPLRPEQLIQIVDEGMR